MPSISIYFAFMKITILENCWHPERGHTPTIFDRGEVVDLADGVAKALIKEGKAEPFEPEVEPAAEPEAPVKVGRKKKAA